MFGFERKYVGDFSHRMEVLFLEATGNISIGRKRD
jgi:hypothetical protein